MSINFSKALGIHEQALGFRAQRAEVLANNIANADTPHFKARDLDFASVLASQADRQGSGPVSLARTNGQHISADGVELADPALRFRNPHHAAIDQNTVDLQVEQSMYTENAVQFQASFTLLNSKFKGLMMALRGE
ncbi:MAG: flagellar basal body rod protein FlgB [Gammaproteobacteria bacterium]|jgi:flagellar basal-body rod protein FlgB|nr:flagellar basal body rod protein FlgB [Gammaproteobacteria bacterium]